MTKEIFCRNCGCILSVKLFRKMHLYSETLKIVVVDFEGHQFSVASKPALVLITDSTNMLAGLLS